MTINIDLPEPIEEKLRNDLGDMDVIGKEAMLVELYRQGKLGHHELSQALRLGRFETDGVLKRHNVIEDLPTPEELDEQLATVRSRSRA